MEEPLTLKMEATTSHKTLVTAKLHGITSYKTVNLILKQFFVLHFSLGMVWERLLKHIPLFHFTSSVCEMYNYLYFYLNYFPDLLSTLGSSKGSFSWKSQWFYSYLVKLLLKQYKNKYTKYWGTGSDLTEIMHCDTQCH